MRELCRWHACSTASSAGCSTSPQLTRERSASMSASRSSSSRDGPSVVLAAPPAAAASCAVSGGASWVGTARGCAGRCSADVSACRAARKASTSAGERSLPVEIFARSSSTSKLAMGASAGLLTKFRVALIERRASAMRDTVSAALWYGTYWRSAAPRQKPGRRGATGGRSPRGRGGGASAALLSSLPPAGEWENDLANGGPRRTLLPDRGAPCTMVKLWCGCYYNFSSSSLAAASALSLVGRSPNVSHHSSQSDSDDAYSEYVYAEDLGVEPDYADSH